MPDHLHWLMQPLPKGDREYWSLGNIVHSIKSYSSKQVGKAMNHIGIVWQDEGREGREGVGSRESGIGNRESGSISASQFALRAGFLRRTSVPRVLSVCFCAHYRTEPTAIHHGDLVGFGIGRLLKFRA